MRSRPRWLPVPLAALALAVAAPVGPGPTRAAADEPAAPPAPAGPALEARFSVGVVRGDAVNLRVGPRQDDQAVQTLDQGTVVVVLERVGDWLEVRLPAGFSGAVAAEYTEPVDDEHVRVTGHDVNLRRGPGLNQPAFRDRLAAGTVLPVLAREGEWWLVEAPEEVRAYVFAAYVEVKGPATAHEDLVLEGRKRRAAREALRSQAVRRTAAEGDEKALRETLALVGKTLGELRAAGGYDVGPVAALEDRLVEELDRRKGAADRTRALATVVVEDLRREQALRVAFADDILAKKRAGQPPPEKAKPPAEVVDAVEVTGVLRWEPAPGWDGGGAFVLWSTPTKPSHAVRWAQGDLKALEGKTVKVKGKQAGTRLLGLPTVDAVKVDAVP